MAHTPGPVVFTCGKCGWSGEVNGRPRCLPCYALAVKVWRANNHDKCLEQKRRADKRLRSERPEKAAERKRNRRARNPQATKAKWAERVAWLKAGDVSRDQLASLFAKSEGRCYLCYVKVARPRFSPNDPRGFDHIVARANGGLHTISNLAVCCGSCNERKAANGS